MDYNYEQTSEVEALDSIYYGDMQSKFSFECNVLSCWFHYFMYSHRLSVIETEPYHKFSIPIKSEEYDDGEGLACHLVFTYTAKYPDELPVIEIDNEDNFDDAVDKNELLEHLTQQVITQFLIIQFYYDYKFHRAQSIWVFS